GGGRDSSCLRSDRCAHAACADRGWTERLRVAGGGSRMTTLAAFLFVIGVIVLVHELGHFVAARRCGVRVEGFSSGFGPKLLTFRSGETAYCISAIPLGGYIKMAGERPETAPSGDGFLSKSKWQQCQILAAGPAMNLLLAAAVVAGIAISGV